VLLVEDNKLDIMVVREAFVRYQITADLHVVEDGDAAIRFIETTENTESAPCPELVLLDLNLPKRNGLEVLERLRRSPLWACVQVIIVSSSSSRRDRIATEQIGINGYFVKPASYEEFLEIGEVIARSLQPPQGPATQ